MASDLPEWLKAEMQKRDWQPADLSRKSGVSESHLSRILSGERGAGPRVAKKLAHGLKVSEDLVLFHAGARSKNPDSITQELDPIALDILQMLEHRTDAQKAAALAALTALFDSLDRGLDGQGSRSGRKIVAGANEI